MAYQFRGKNRTVEPEPTQPLPRGAFDPDKCGTYAGYRQHQKHNDPACQDCKDACADYSREYYRLRKEGHEPSKGFDPSFCGTYAGYCRHRRHDVPFCGPCKDAHVDYMTAYRIRRKTAAAAEGERRFAHTHSIQ